MRTLVIGGTGRVGSEVTKRLLASGEKVSVLTPNAQLRTHLGAPVVHGDLNDPASIHAAMRGAERVFLLIAQSPNETAQGLAAVAAARAATVSRMVYMSVRMPDFAPAVPHFASKMRIEQAVRASGIPFVILRPNNFFQNDLDFLQVIVDYGIYPQPIGGKGLARIDVRDIADAAVNALTRAEHVGTTYELNGPDLLTGEDVAAIYGSVLHKPMRYAGDSLDAWAAGVSAVLPAWLVNDLRIMYQNFQQYGMASTPCDDQRLRALLGHAPRAFRAFASEVTA